MNSSEKAFLKCRGGTMKNHKRGLIIGPKESVEEFEMRANIEARSSFPKCLKTLFGISPDWVSVIYKNKGLRLWEGGCSWIEPSKVSIQLRGAFQKREKIWWLYSRDELLAHEGVHATRVTFDEPIFEEVLAYQTSKSSFRRYLGPIFKSPKESIFFMGSMTVLPLNHLAIFFPLALALFGVVRLAIKQRCFQKAKLQISKLFGSDKALGFMLHLTDQEIIRFSKGKKMVAYIKEQSCNRWQQIKSEFDVESYSQFQVQHDI